MRPLNRLETRFVVLDIDNVDTDQIIPARFLTATGRDGMAAGLFADWRHGADGDEHSDFVLNRPEAKGAGALVVGRNFGCGSSREHAAWALLDNGIRVVIGTEIADIFRANALKNGLLPLLVADAVQRRLVEAGSGTLEVDVEAQTLRLPNGFEVAFPIDPFARHCLIEGIDELGYLLAQQEAIDGYETGRTSRGA